MDDNKSTTTIQLKGKDLEEFIIIDKWHSLRNKETYLGYQLKRMWYYLKYNIKTY
tara:strand:+ start:5813 stop:5977 length:165 start_codon:yes stop_codon:yes gene_type:complete